MEEYTEIHFIRLLSVRCLRKPRSPQTQIKYCKKKTNIENESDFLFIFNLLTMPERLVGRKKMIGPNYRL